MHKEMPTHIQRDQFASLRRSLPEARWTSGARILAPKLQEALGVGSTWTTWQAAAEISVPQRSQRPRVTATPFS